MKKVSEYAEEFKDAPYTCDCVCKWLSNNEPAGTYPDLIKCFQTKGEEGEDDDKEFYKWLKANYKTKCKALEPLRDKEDFDDFVFKFGKIEPCHNQKWHFYVSVLAYRECVTELHLKSIVKPYKRDNYGNYITNYTGFRFCKELDIWFKQFRKKYYFDKGILSNKPPL